jgi:hypothetical protein
MRRSGQCSCGSVRFSSPLAVLSLLALPFFAYATPEVPPGGIFGIYAERVELCFPDSGCEGETLNYVLVAPRANHGVGVRIELVFGAGHRCTFEENGEWRKDRVVATMFYQHGGEKECRLELTFDNKNVRLHDVDDRCRIPTCGARGGYTGVQLPKKGAF